MSQKEHIPEAESDLQVAEDTRVKKPRMYLVLLLNDDFTPMDFVVWILKTVFHKSDEEAHRLTMDVHTKGSGLCGLYTYDVARTKVIAVKNLAKKAEHPLECMMEVQD